MAKGYIYKATNKINGKSYIGKTINFDRRKHQHLTGKGGTCAFKNAINKYGGDCFCFEIILFIEMDDIKLLNKKLSEMEVFYIKQYNTFKNGYNATLGGEGTSGYHYSEEEKKKQSERRKKYLSIPENRKRHKEISKKAMQKFKGIPRSKDVIMKGAIKRRKPILQYDINGNFIKEYSGATKVNNYEEANIIACCKGRLNSAYGFVWRYKKNNCIPLTIHVSKNINPKNKPIIQLDKKGNILREYSCVNTATEITGIKRSAIANCLAGLTKTSGGYMWNYKERKEVANA